MTNEMKKEIVVKAINGMNKTTLKKMVCKYITYVPGSSDVDLHYDKIRNQAVEIYNAMFADMYEGMTRINGEDAPKYGEDVRNAVESIADMLDGSISIRGIYNGVRADGSKGLYMIDNITYKKSGIYRMNGSSLTMEDVKRFGEGVDVMLLGDDVKKELGL